jgi:hypothetical protein
VIERSTVHYRDSLDFNLTRNGCGRTGPATVVVVCAVSAQIRLIALAVSLPRTRRSRLKDKACAISSIKAARFVVAFFVTRTIVEEVLVTASAALLAAGGQISSTVSVVKVACRGVAAVVADTVTLERSWTERHIGTRLNVRAVATVKLASGGIAGWVAEAIRNPYCLAASRALALAVTLMRNLCDLSLDFRSSRVGVHLEKAVQVGIVQATITSADVFIPLAREAARWSFITVVGAVCWPRRIAPHRGAITLRFSFDACTIVALPKR